MNNLESFVSEIGLDPVKALNLLDEAGIVSNQCVTLADVAEADQSAAIKFLDGIS